MKTHLGLAIAEIKMKISICILVLSVLFLQGCIFLPFLGVSATTGAAVVKYKWHKDEVVRTEAFREAVLDGFDEINKKLEDSIEMRRMRSGDDS